MQHVVRQYDQILERIRREAEASRRNPETVRLLAVSKTFPAGDIAALYRHGCRRFGESRIAELEEKASSLPSDIEWHFIGQLQSNKVRRAVRTAAFIHSVNSPALLERIDRIAGEESRRPKILLEVNVSGEPSKSGCPPEEILRLAELAADARNLDFLGLMTMAPADAAEEDLDRFFGETSRLKQDLERRLRRSLPELSMGMSSDYRTAIRHGATIVRIGTAIFGRRDAAAADPSPAPDRR